MLGIRSVTYSATNCDVSLAARYNPQLQRDYMTCWMCLYLQQMHTRTNTKRSRWVSPAYLFSTGETTLLCVSIRVRICQHKDPAVSQPHMLNAHKWKDTQGPVTSQMAFVPVTRLDDFVLCVCVNTLHSECIVCDISITVCIVCLCGSLLAKPFLRRRCQDKLDSFFFFFFVNKSGKCNYNKFSNQSLEETTNQYGDGNWWVIPGRWFAVNLLMRWTPAEVESSRVAWRGWGKNTETNCDLRRLHISFTGYSVVGEIGTLCGAPPQHFSLTGGEAIGGVSNLAVAARPDAGELSYLPPDRTYWAPQM